MAQHVLVPFDGSPMSERALDRAVETFPDAEITLLRVVDPIGVVYEAEAHGLPEAERWHDRATAAAERLLATAADRARDAGAEAATAVETGRPARAILAYVADHDIDQVVIGSHSKGLERLLLGSTAERVLRRSPVPVTVVR
ncbi:MAG: universal stress protein [Haloglomus sp.]